MIRLMLLAALLMRVLFIATGLYAVALIVLFLWGVV